MSHIADILSVRKRRLSLQREVDLLEQEEKTLTNALINFMNVNEKLKLKEGEDEVVLVNSMEPMAVNWPHILDYIVEHDAVDLLQKRLTASAVKARFTEGEKIPGIELTLKQTLKFNI